MIWRFTKTYMDRAGRVRNARLASRFARVRVRAAGEGTTAEEPEEWLIVEWPKGEKEPTKFWLSTLPEDMAFERMIEHHVYWALVGARWVDPANFAKGPAHFFDRVPDHQRDKVREDAQFRVAENYLLSGLGRHAPDEDVDLALRSLLALSVQLGDKTYLMGEEPCGTDATAFGALAGILTPFFDSTLRERAEKFDNLTAYVDRMMARYYPEFAWKALQQAVAA